MISSSSREFISFVFRPSTGLTFRGDCVYANGVAAVSLGLAAVRGGLPQVRGRVDFSYANGVAPTTRAQAGATPLA